MASSHTVTPPGTSKTALRWDLELVQERAQKEFGNDFESLPATWSLDFQSRPAQVNVRSSPTLTQPIQPATIMLKLGHTNGRQDPVPTGSMLVAIDGVGHNNIRYIHESSEQTILDRQACCKILRHVNFEEPFCDIGDNLTSSRAAYNMVRALVLYYFLAAGYIREIDNYYTFWRDFGKACGWVARNGERSKAASRPKRESESNDGLESDASSDEIAQLSPLSERAQSQLVETADTQVKRVSSEADISEYSTPKRFRTDRAADEAHITPTNYIPILEDSSLITAESATQTVNTAPTYTEDRAQATEEECARLKLRLDAMSKDYNLSETRNHISNAQINDLTTSKTTLQAQNDALTTRVHDLQTQQDYDQNAYNGLKHKHDQVLLDVANGKQAYNQLQVDYNVLQSRASEAQTTSKVFRQENAELRSRVREVEVKVMKTMEDVQRFRRLMKKELGGIDQEYGCLPEDK